MQMENKTLTMKLSRYFDKKQYQVTTQNTIILTKTLQIQDTN